MQTKIAFKKDNDERGDEKKEENRRDGDDIV